MELWEGGKADPGRKRDKEECVGEPDQMINPYLQLIHFRPTSRIIWELGTEQASNPWVFRFNRPGVEFHHFNL